MKLQELIREVEFLNLGSKIFGKHFYDIGKLEGIRRTVEAFDENNTKFESPYYWFGIDPKDWQKLKKLVETQ